MSDPFDRQEVFPSMGFTLFELLASYYAARAIIETVRFTIGVAPVLHALFRHCFISFTQMFIPSPLSVMREYLKGLEGQKDSCDAFIVELRGHIARLEAEGVR